MELEIAKTSESHPIRVDFVSRKARGIGKARDDLGVTGRSPRLGGGCRDNLLVGDRRVVAEAREMGHARLQAIDPRLLAPGPWPRTGSRRSRSPRRLGNILPGNRVGCGSMGMVSLGFQFPI